MDDYKFCPHCGSNLSTISTEATVRPQCPGCKKIIYYDPKLAAATVVEKNGLFLMIKRAIQPQLGLWGFPGGYVDRGEVVENAAAREVLEETGLIVKITRSLGVFSEQGNPVILAAFAGTEVGGELKIGDEVSDIGFFSPDELPPLAFPRDMQVLKSWQDTTM